MVSRPVQLLRSSSWYLQLTFEPQRLPAAAAAKAAVFVICLHLCSQTHPFPQLPSGFTLRCWVGGPWSVLLL